MVGMGVGRGRVLDGWGAHARTTSHTRSPSRPPPTPPHPPLPPPQVDDDASPDDIKAAYRYLAKACHPDVHADGHDLCVLLNEAYTTLSNDTQRAAYNGVLQAALDEAADDFTDRPLSKWLVGHKLGKAAPGETRGVFVDELACIGCQNCIFEAAATFRMEKTHGRARVFAQWVDPEARIQRSIDACPVSCIHWVDADDLPALEYVTQRVLTERKGVAAMMAGQGGAAADPFAAAAQFKKERAARAATRAAAAAREAAASPARAAARAAAAEAIRKENFGIFAGLAAAFESALGGAGASGGAPSSSSSAAASEGSDSDSGAVGSRRRASRRTRRSLNAGGGIVPDDRALVLAREPDP